MDIGFAIGSIVRLQVPRVRMANGWALGKFAGEFAPARRLTLGSSNLVYFLRAYFAYTASHVRLWPVTSLAVNAAICSRWKADIVRTWLIGRN